MKYNYLIVGSGFFGAICAYELNKIGKRCLVLEKRPHVGGNCYTEKKDGINIHTYGPHIFHTSNDLVWKWINQFVEFNNYKHTPLANFKNEIYSLPFSMWTFSKMWGITYPAEAKKIIEKQSSKITNPVNLEEQAIKLVGKDVYYKLIKGYTEKQWKKPANELPKEIIKRLIVRFNYDNSYFNDKYQGIPIGGYTQIFEKILGGIEIRLNTDYLKNKEYWNSITEKVIYTGPIDAYFDYRFGELEYKTNRFVNKRIDTDNYQGISVMNYTEFDVPYTRTIEHKHFESSNSQVSWVTWEYPDDYVKDKEPYYPVNDDVNNFIFEKYKKLSESSENIFFGGRLAEYKYYDMHDVIYSALTFIGRLQNI
jgi:UDP-galactopyranose mutase